MQGDYTIYPSAGWSGMQFVNAGTFRKSAGTNTCVVTGFPFYNTGSIQSLSGRVDLQSGGALTGTCTAAAAGAAVTFSGGSFTLAAGAVFTGPGFVGVANGGPTFSGTLATAMQWSGGSLGGNWSIAPSGSLTLNGTATKYLDGAITNAGTMVLASGFYFDANNAQIVNQASGLVDVQGDYSIYPSAGYPGMQIANAGTFRKSAGSGSLTLQIPLVNSGQLAIQSGALNLATTLTLNTAGTATGAVIVNGVAINGTLHGSLTWLSGTLYGQLLLANDGVLSLSGAATKYLGGTLTNAGTMNVGSVLVFDQPGVQVVNQAGALVDVQGDYAIYPSSGYSGMQFINAGTFRKSAGTNTAAVSGIPFLNTGTVESQRGLFSFDAAFTNAAGGLAVRLNSVGDWGRIAWSGPLTLNGSFSVSLLSGYTPALSNTFQVFTFPSVTGSFTTYNGLELGGGLKLTPKLDPTAFSLTVEASSVLPPTILTQPASQTVPAGTNVTFNVAASGTPPLSYLWQFNGTNLAGATNPTLTLTNVQLNQAGSYAVVVTNAVGFVLSSNAVLTVNGGAYQLSRIELRRTFITAFLAANSTQPTNETVSADSRSFQLGWNFKWPDATTGPNWNIASATTTLTQAPASVMPGSSATFAASVAGRWDTSGYGIDRDHTISLAGVAGTNQYSIVGSPSSVQTGQFGVTNTVTVPAAMAGEIGLVLNVGLRFGDDHTGAMEIKLVYAAAAPTPPAIVTQPTSQTVTAGTNVTFNVSASGTPPLSYQWTFNGTNTAGATNATLTLTNVQLNQAGSYAVVVTNAVGFVLSSNAILTVNPASGNCVPAPAGLVSWWGGNGNATDSVGGNDGVVAGSTTFVPGRVGEAFSFDGVSGWVDIPLPKSLDPTGPFSVEAWIKANPHQPNPDGIFLIVDKSHGFVDYTGWGLQGNGNGTVGFFFGTGGGFPQVNTATSVLDDQWHHVAGVFTGTRLQIYLDGGLQGSLDQTVLPANNSRPVEIGHSWGGGTPTRYFHGLIDEISYYSRGLSSNEVAAIYAAGSAGKCSAAPVIPTGLRADYRFQNSLLSSVGNPPALSNLGSNAFITATVDGTPQTVLAFDFNDGVLLQPGTSVIPNNVYSVVILAALDDVSYYRRLLGFPAIATDEGWYVHNGRLTYWPAVDGSSEAVAAGQFVQFAVTRAPDGTVRGYVDGVLQAEFPDADGSAGPGTNGLLRFFQDNATDASAGQVARIRIYDIALTDAQVAALDRLPPAGPVLVLTRAGNAVTVSWPTNYSGYRLRSAPSLTPPMSWTTLNNVAVFGPVFQATVSATNNRGFFQLMKP